MAIKTQESFSIPINAIRLQDLIIENHPDTIIVDDFARGAVTSLYKKGDSLSLVTYDPSLLVDIPIMIRTLFGASHRTRDVGENNDVVASIICADTPSNPESEEDAKFKFGYLTSEQWMSVKKPKQTKNLILSDTDPIVPLLTKVTMKYRAKPNTEVEDIVIYAHLLKKDTDLNLFLASYAEALRDPKIMTANFIYLKNNQPYSLPGVPNALDMAMNKISDVYSPFLEEQGWNFTQAAAKDKPEPKSKADLAKDLLEKADFFNSGVEPVYQTGGNHANTSTYPSLTTTYNTWVQATVPGTLSPIPQAAPTIGGS